MILFCSSFTLDVISKSFEKDMNKPVDGKISCSLRMDPGPVFTDPSQCHILSNGGNIRVMFITSRNRKPNTETNHYILVKSDKNVVMMLGGFSFKFKSDDPTVDIALDTIKHRFSITFLAPMISEGLPSASLAKGSFIYAEDE
jgi:hypothetical protein